MTVLPIVARELLVQARRKSTYWMRAAAAAVAGFLAVWLLVVTAASVPMAGQGKTLFSILSTLAFSYCLVIGAVATADCLSAEKREDTLGLLFLTHLKGHDVILGKLVSASVHAAYGLMGIVPVMSMSLLFGGVTAGELARTALVLGNTLFFSLAAGICVSTISQNERKALFGALLLIFIVTACPFQAGYYLVSSLNAPGGPRALESTLFWPSPGFAFALARSPATLATLGTPAFYGSVAVTHALAWGLLAIACRVVPRVWKDRPLGRKRERWNERLRRWRLGAPESRRAFRRRALERNPGFWLSSRERYKAASVWVLVLPFAAIGLWIYYKYPGAFEASLLLLALVHVLLKLWFAVETCSRWMEDRRCGALELLACAPLRLNELVQGQSMALRRQFGFPVVMVLGLTLIVWIKGPPDNYHWSPPMLQQWLQVSLPVLLADLLALRWVGAWLGLTARGLNRSIIRTLTCVLGLRWLIYTFSVGAVLTWSWLGVGRAQKLPGPIFWFGAALTLDLIFGWWSRHKFLRHFRVVAANPLGWRAALREGTASADSNRERVPRTGAFPRARDWMGARRRAIAGVALVLLIVAVPLSHRFWLKWRVEVRLTAMKQAGIPMRLSELEGRRPALMNTVNAAEVLEAVFPNLVLPHRLPAAVQKNFPAWRSPARRGRFSSSQMEAIASLLASNQTALAIVHQGPPLSTGQYALDWTGAGLKVRNQWQACSALSQLLRWEALLRAEEGDPGAAVRSLKRLLELGRSMEREPMMPHQRISCLAGALDALEWLLNRQTLSHAQLRDLQQSVAEVQAGIDLQPALLGMKCSAAQWYHSPPPFPGVVGAPAPPAGLDAARLQIRSWIREWAGINDREFIRYHDVIEGFLSRTEDSWPALLGHARTIEGPDPWASGLNGPGSVFNPRFPIDYVIFPYARLEACLRATLASLSIERYRLEHHGQWPERLDQLVPQWLAEIPRDPFDGQPLRYRPGPAGYSVYSIGGDFKDDGGTNRPPFQMFGPPKAQEELTFIVEHVQ